MISICENVGLTGTTPIHSISRDDGMIEVRMGIALFGMTNMREDDFERCGRNPFHEQFFDNYVKGEGKTLKDALSNLSENAKQTADSLWV